MKNKKYLNSTSIWETEQIIEGSKAHTLYNVSSESFTKHQDNINIAITKQ